jgi:transposase
LSDDANAATPAPADPPKPKHPGGRPSKLTAAVQAAIVKALRQGNYIEAAAGIAGVTKQVVYDWMRAGAQGKAPKYVKFLDAVKKAQADAETRHVGRITKAAEKQWQASAWMLERKFPDRWGQRIKVEVERQMNRLLDILRDGLPPETYEHVLALLESARE